MWRIARPSEAVTQTSGGPPGRELNPGFGDPVYGKGYQRSTKAPVRLRSGAEQVWDQAQKKVFSQIDTNVSQARHNLTLGEVTKASMGSVGSGKLGPQAVLGGVLPSNAAVGGAAGGGATGSAVESAISKGVGAVDGFVTQTGNKAVNAFKGMDWAAARGNWKQLGGHLWNTKPMLRGSAYLAGAGLALGAASGLLRNDRSMIGNTFGAAGSMIGSGLTFGALGAAGGMAFGAARSGMALRKAGLAMGSKMGAATMAAGGMRMVGRGGMYGAMAGMAWGALGNAFGSGR